MQSLNFLSIMGAKCNVIANYFAGYHLSLLNGQPHQSLIDLFESKVSHAFNNHLFFLVSIPGKPLLFYTSSGEPKFPFYKNMKLVYIKGVEEGLLLEVAQCIIEFLDYIYYASG